MIQWIVNQLKQAAAQWLQKRFPGVFNSPRDPRRQLSGRERSVVYQRDWGRCRYCGTRVSYQSCHIDHVYPHSRGGETSIENSVVACSTCNRRKSDSVGVWPLPITKR